VLHLLILIILMALLVVVLGLPLLLGSDSPIPDYIGFGIVAAAVGFFVWSGIWWILLPIAFLVALVVWMDSGGQDAPADPAGLDRRGWSARTRLRFGLWCAAILAIPALIASVFILPDGSVGIVMSTMVIVMAAMSLFRFSFCRSARRDEPG
jgi:hypothetical protein